FILCTATMCAASTPGTVGFIVHMVRDSTRVFCMKTSWGCSSIRRKAIGSAKPFSAPFWSGIPDSPPRELTLFDLQAKDLAVAFLPPFQHTGSRGQGPEFKSGMMWRPFSLIQHL